MWIKRVKLKNFGCHEDFEQTFVRGLVGIFGPNGSGKSTIVDGIYYALTGDLGRFHGVKSDQIRADSEETDKSFIEVTAEHDGVEFTIHRGLRPNKQSLQMGDDKPVTKSGEIQDRLNDLGVDAKLIGTYVFVGQWSMFDFISQTPGDRAKTYQHLCNTGRAQNISDAIDKLLAQDQDLSVELHDNSDGLLVEISELQSQLDEHREAYRLAKLGQLSAELYEENSNLVARRELRIKAQAAVKQQEASLVKRKAAADNYGKLLESAVVEKELWRTKLAEAVLVTKVADKAAEEANKWVVCKNRIAAKERALKECQDIPESPAKPDTVRLEKLEKALAKTDAELDRVSTFLKTFEKSGVTSCETCGTPTAKLNIAESRQRGDELAEKSAELGSECARISGEVYAYRAWERVKADKVLREELVRSTLVELRETLSKLSEPETSGDFAELLQSAIEVENTARENLESASESVTDLKVSAAEAATSILAFESAIAEQKAILKDNPLTKAAWERAKKLILAHDRAVVDIRVAKKSGKNAADTLKARKASLAELKAKLKKNARARKFADIMSSVKSVFHRQRLPREVAAKNLADMEAGINEGLSSFGDPFYVEATDDLSFDAYFPGQPPLPASRLSGGQKGVLAVVFRREIARLFANDMGMMALDEPTAGMDVENVSNLESALTRYAGELKGKSQVLMITHSDTLRPAFEQIVELGLQE